MTAIRKNPEMFMPSETVLELVQLQAGVIALRSADFDLEASEGQDASDMLADGSINAVSSATSSEPLVTIKFSDEIQAALGDSLQAIGQQMIQSALAALMEQQSAKWHAQVMDECPAHYS